MAHQYVNEETNDNDASELRRAELQKAGCLFFHGPFVHARW
jgi:hypothetical protein